MNLKSTWDWACEYTGDPASWSERGEMFFQFLRDEGLQKNHRVLEIGSGNLSSGVPLIRFLDHNNYVGLEPNGWLTNVALERFPDLPGKGPRFLTRTDFAVIHDKVDEFDFVLAHSVLSHVAFWQMSQALIETRRVVTDQGIWLATVRLDQYDDFATDWTYPGVNKFKLDTIKTIAHHAGWSVRRKRNYEERLQYVAPNDTHEVLRLEATFTSGDANRVRLDMDERKREEDEIREIARQLRAEREKKRLEEQDAEQQAWLEKVREDADSE